MLTNYVQFRFVCFQRAEYPTVKIELVKVKVVITSTYVSGAFFLTVIWKPSKSIHKQAIKGKNGQTNRKLLETK